MNSPVHAPDPTRHEEFVRLFGLNQGRVFAFLLTLLPTYADAEEVLQQTSIVIWRKFDQFDSQGDFVRWACGIAYREALNFLKRQRRDRHAFGETVLEKVAAERLDRAGVLDRRRTALEKCLQKLNPRDRQTVEHYYYRGRTTASDVAAALGRPVDTVYKALARIRQALHQCIDRTVAAEERS
jgi:RNA polymerase sigma-70 factor (ECF subfamily)